MKIRHRALVCLAAALTVFIAAGAIQDVLAACPVAVLPSDGSTSGNARAPSIRYGYARSVYLIKASEIQASGLQANGLITAIGWGYTTAPGAVGSAPLKVYLQNTSDVTNTKSTSWATAISGMTLVHNATTQLPNSLNPFDITFTGTGISTFTYTGGGIYVAFDWGAYTGTLSTTTVVDCNSTGLTGGLLGAQSNVSAPSTLTASNFRPMTRLSGPVPPLDLSVDFIASMGAIPFGLAPPVTVKATVFQNGDTTATDVPVSLAVSGTETFNDTITVASLGACGTSGSVVTFNAFTPTLIGDSWEDVSVPTDGDSNTDNNLLSRLLNVTLNRYSFKHEQLQEDGGVGLSNGTGEFLAKFTVTAPTQIDAITPSFFATTATTYRLVVRADDGTGKPGALLYLDGADRTVTSAGDQTFALPAPLEIGAGSVFVGIRQTNTTNANFSFNYEYPIRANTFYYSTTPDAGPWTEFGAGGIYYQLNIGIYVGQCLAPLSVAVNPPGPLQTSCNGNVFLGASMTGGTAPFTYQWTENGVDIPGANADTLNISRGSGTYVYECRVTDAGGCRNVTSNAVTASFGPTATVSGGGSICGAGSAQISAALTGGGPWTITWSDGFVQNADASPAVRTVSPVSTTTYTVTAVSDATCAGTASGSALVTVDAGPAETAPAELVWTGTTELDWAANPAAASYTLYRGPASSLASLPSGAAACTRATGAATSATGLVEVPAEGDAFWYLVTATSAAGCEGTAGDARLITSSGTCP